MATIVDLDTLVGGDLTFKYADTDLRIPGDISTKTVFQIFQAFRELSDVQETGDPDQIQSANTLINEQLLILFQIRQPDMKELPFGIKTLPIVIQEILKLLGVNVLEDDANPPARSRARTSKQTKKKSSPKTSARSRPSSGSSSS